MTHLIAFALGYLLGAYRQAKKQQPLVEQAVEEAVEVAHAFGMSWRHAASVWRQRALEMRQAMSPSRFDEMDFDDPMSKH